MGQIYTVKDDKGNAKYPVTVSDAVFIGGKKLTEAHRQKADQAEIERLDEECVKSREAGEADLTQGGNTVVIEDNLVSTSKTTALSANQGRVLKELIDSIPQGGGSSGGGGASVPVVDNLTSTSTTSALSANQGKVLKGMIKSFAITEDMVTVVKDSTYGEAPYNTSYKYTSITISKDSGIEWVRGATYFFVIDTKMVVASANRNVRVRIGDDGEWKPVCGYTTTIMAGSTYFVKAQNILFTYKETSIASGALHQLYDANSNTYQRTYMTATDVEVPVSCSSTGSTTTAWADPSLGSYKDCYGVISSVTDKRPTINPSTGRITIHLGSCDEPTQDSDIANKGYVDGLVGNIETLLAAL